eukprot:TRINITY_DN4058_c0_g1_i4.p1 TRINITY_DN4058_c0_g1~~TRINITY_DN4058_c0_g1_i4.p1  ORF type:complete len:177 (-),score=39.52 TRINITY_DN4058_c0_g1_i4:1-462(-)
MASKRLLVTFFWDLVAFICLGSVTLVLKYGGLTPYQWGFFCYDMSIRHPYKSSTIGSEIAIAISLVVPVVYIFLVEVGRYLKTPGGGREKLAVFGSDWYHYTSEHVSYLFLIHIWSRLPCELVIALVYSRAAVWPPSPTGCKSWFGEGEAVTL